ncbi:ABC transporter substrate-binding protein [Devosia sp.]|uniref:ABC transporter substrate-binding protein n=1 Tax=Devosia sp. TaxID=1871048 RepID=UPI001AC8B1B5|nr:ABC transporter substrate-binding protein [Devosia sp.]MBN9334893.1 ABC transporter substrate-binding protein [Devosia sp.]
MTTKTLRHALTAGLGAVAALMLTTASFAAPKVGGTLNWAIHSEAGSIVPTNTTTFIALAVGPKIFEGLLSYDENFEPQAQLATQWSVSDDGLSYTFKLRPNVKWHDGTPFTSKDVAFSIERLKAGHPRGQVTFANVSKIETPDDLTVVVSLSAPTPYLLTAVASPESPIVPQHLFENINVVDTPPDAALIGTGPFMFREWTRGDHLILERNPDYWAAGKPYLERIIGKIVTDSAARSAGLETGELDLASVALSDVERLKSITGLTVADLNAPYLGRHSQIALNLDNEKLADLQVRRAIAHALDLEAIKSIVFYGYGTVSPTPISRALTAYNDPSILPHNYDTILANQLLDEAGYAKDDSGVRFKLRVTLNPANDSRVAAFVQQSLKAIGIEAEVSLSDQAAYSKRVYTDRDFDVAIDSLGNTFDPTVGVQRVFWSNAFKVGVPWANPSHYANPVVDDILERAAVEVDATKRKELFFQLQAIVHDELPVIDFIDPPEFYAYRDGLSGFSVGAHGIYNNFANAHFEQ